MSKKSKLISSLLSITLLGTLFIGCGQSVTNKGEEVKTAEGTQVEAKAASGDITIYTSQPEEDIQKLIENFNKKNPDVNVNVFRSGTEEVVSKILAEKEANAVQADLLLVSDAVTFEALKEKDMLETYKSSELEGIDSKYVDKDNMYTGTKVISTGIIVNTNNVKVDPSSLNDLLKPEAKGKVIMPSPLYSGAAAYNVGVMTRTEGLGWKFFEGLKSNEVQVDKGNGAILKAVAGGQKDYGLIVDYMAVRSAKEGSPVKFIYPEEGVPAITEPIGIIKGSKNLDAAKEFVDYILSEEGQQVAADMGYAPVKSSVKAPEGLKLTKDLKVISYDNVELLKNREEDKNKFSSLFN